MSAAAVRRMRLRNFECMYERRGRIGDPCTYCGVESDTFDHIPPISMIDMEASAGVDVAKYNMRKVPACLECNLALGDLRLMSVSERRAHVKQKLRKKYAKFLRMPRGDEDEFDDVSERFADDVRRASIFAEWVKQRLSFYGGSK